MSRIDANNLLGDNYFWKSLSLIPVIGTFTSSKVSTALEVEMARLNLNFNHQKKETSLAQDRYIKCLELQNQYRLIDGIRWTFIATISAVVALSYPILSFYASIFSASNLLYAGRHFYTFYSGRYDIHIECENMKKVKPKSVLQTNKINQQGHTPQDATART